MRLMIPVASLATASVVALGTAGCGDSSETTSTAATQTQSPTTTGAQGSSAEAPGIPGVTLTTATAGEPGAVVQSVRPDANSRLKPGDVIVAYNDKPVAGADELISAIGTPDIGESFTIKVVRGSHQFTLREVQSPTAYLGAEVKDATGSAKGAVVVSVAADSPAAAADLRHGDVITAVDDTQVASVQDLLQALGTHVPGDKVSITVSRGSGELQVTATLADRPAPSTK